MAPKKVTNNEPFMIAVRTGRLAQVRQLLEAGEDPDMHTDTGWTPLHSATWNRQLAVVKLLLEHHAPLEAIFKHRTPLGKAIERGYLDLAEVLLEAGADIEAGSGTDWTPLIIATSTGNLRSVKWLLDHGANVNAQSGRGWTGLHEAAFNGYTEIVRLLLKHKADTEILFKNTRTPLHKTAERGEVDAAKALIEAGANIDAKDLSLWTPLYIAAMEGHEELAKLYLEKGAEVDCRATDGSTPLYAATKAKHRALVLLLLQSGAPMSPEVDKTEYSALHEAADQGLTEIAKLLLEFGANIEARCKGKSTPLHIAVLKGHTKLVQLLLERKANPRAKDADGKTPETIASENNHAEISALLATSDESDLSTQLSVTNLNGNSVEATLLMAKGVQGAQEWLTKIDRINALIASAAALNPNVSPVRIAVLDTGCSRKSSYFTQYPEQLKRIKGDHWRDFAGSEKRAVDIDGVEHGTMVTTLLLRVARNAEIFVARIAQTAQELSGAAENVAAAIRHAQDPEGWNVDLICMSFGFNSRIPTIEHAILGVGQAVVRSPPVFLAAAANNGANSRELFPAYLNSVISVRGTDSYGTFVGAYNPPPMSMNEGLPMYGTLGENVPYVAGETSSGCSVATPIMAGMIALIMQWVAYKGADEDTQRKLRSTAGVRELFKRMAVPRGDNRFYVHLWDIFANEGKYCVTRVEAAMLDVP
ncbi:Ankyrin-1 [Orbilia brochopaga]|nr:Ankyrin-1 [Drechslerella brochopaga]